METIEITPDYNPQVKAIMRIFFEWHTGFVQDTDHYTIISYSGDRFYYDKLFNVLKRIIIKYEEPEDRTIYKTFDLNEIKESICYNYFSNYDFELSDMWDEPDPTLRQKVRQEINNKYDTMLQKYTLEETIVKTTNETTKKVIKL